MPDALDAQAELPTQAVQDLLRHAGVDRVGTITPMRGGGNNRAFRVDTSDGPRLLKQYYRHPDDPRDRLAHEFAFSSFAWERGLRCLPQPLAKDDDAGLGLYAFVAGRMLEPDEVTPDRVDEAICFFTALNAHRDHPDAASLPPGSESCFSNIEHVALVDRRVRGLDAIGDPTAAAFVERELKPCWADIHPKIARAEDAMEATPRCLSPSDFGFHNAMLPTAPSCRAEPAPHSHAGLSQDEAPRVNAGPGQLVFHDFEYAGLDDPAKLLGDFFHQPRRPAPGSAYPAFEDAVIDTLQLDDAERHRFRTLLPVYRVKWCGIILAPLLPGAAERRKYAGVEIDPQAIVNRAMAMLHEPRATSH